LLFLIRGGRGGFTGDCAISTEEKRGFWMVNHGEFVVETWLLRTCFSGAKKLHFFEVYF
jgi:hypothetical protein